MGIHTVGHKVWVPGCNLAMDGDGTQSAVEVELVVLKEKYAAMKERKNKSVELLRLLKSELEATKKQQEERDSQLGIAGWESMDNTPLGSMPILKEAAALSTTDSALLRSIDENSALPSTLRSVQLELVALFLSLLCPNSMCDDYFCWPMKLEKCRCSCESSKRHENSHSGSIG